MSKRERMSYATLLIEAGLAIGIILRPDAAADLSQMAMWVAGTSACYVGGDTYRSSGSAHAAHRPPSTVRSEP